MIGVQRLQKRRSNWSAKPNLAGGLRVTASVIGSISEATSGGCQTLHGIARRGFPARVAPDRQLRVAGANRAAPVRTLFDDTPMRAECIPADAEWPESDGLGGFASGSAQDARTPSFAVTGAAQ
jgi:hypothetical protein